MGKLSSTGKFFQDVWRLTKSYWKSEEKKSAYLLLVSIFILTIGSVFMLVQLNTWQNSFYTALQNYDSEAIIDELINFTWMAVVYIIFVVYAFYLQQVLCLRWRKWLTLQYISHWLDDKTYYRMQMFGTSTDNPDQRISEDINLFVDKTLEFTIGFIKALCTLGAFIVILYEISGTLDFTVLGMDIHIPGYLVWAAILYAVLGTAVTHLVGRKLMSLNFIQQRYEADFRFSMMRMRENAESVAFYDGEKQEENIFQSRFMLLLGNFWKIIKKKKQLIWINSGYSQLAVIFPLVVVMPRYLTRQFSLGGLMQVINAFTSVQASLSYFVDMYTLLAEWKAVVDRLTGFTQQMTIAADDTQGEMVVQHGTGDSELAIDNFDVRLPNGIPLFQHVTLKMQAGTNILIRGASGCGKSTFLRAIAGIWPYITGHVTMPSKKSIMFVPQKPYLPLGTLRQALLYPGKDGVEDSELISLLELCHIGHLKDQLDAEADWSHVLSGGEQQRLAFVRILLQKPQWLFLDEASSALDEETEAYMYNLLKTKLPGTTCVSVGHRSTLLAFHPLAWTLHRDTQRITVEPIVQ